MTSPINKREREIVYMGVDRLLLDSENPRLASSALTTGQKDLLRVLWTEMAVDEVALSIAENGFFPEEPLFVIPAETTKQKASKNKFVVVEGNRRLAAVMLLRDDNLRKELKATDIPSIGAKKKAALDQLPVSIYNDREELWEYFGFRHINGPKEWDAFSKASYVATVYEQYHVPLDKIARKIGDYHSTVKRLYRGYVLLRQAEAKAGFNKEDRIRNRFYFSHLYTAADQQEFQQFLGISAQTSLRANPVPKAKLENLGELMIWLYGSKSEGKEPIVTSQNPDLNLLRRVVGQPNALAGLRSGLSLYRAHDIAVGDKSRFRWALTRAREELVQASGTVTTGYSGEDDLYQTMTDILLVGGGLRETMEKKRAKAIKT
jgi:hypothetical protein